MSCYFSILFFFIKSHSNLWYTLGVHATYRSSHHHLVKADELMKKRQVQFVDLECSRYKAVSSTRGSRFWKLNFKEDIVMSFFNVYKMYVFLINCYNFNYDRPEALLMLLRLKALVSLQQHWGWLLIDTRGLWDTWVVSDDFAESLCPTNNPQTLQTSPVGSGDPWGWFSLFPPHQRRLSGASARWRAETVSRMIHAAVRPSIPCEVIRRREWHPTRPDIE